MLTHESGSRMPLCEQTPPTQVNDTLFFFSPLLLLLLFRTTSQHSSSSFKMKNTKEDSVLPLLRRRSSVSPCFIGSSSSSSSHPSPSLSPLPLLPSCRGPSEEFLHLEHATSFGCQVGRLFFFFTYRLSYLSFFFFLHKNPQRTSQAQTAV